MTILVKNTRKLKKDVRKSKVNVPSIKVKDFKKRVKKATKLKSK